MEYNKTRNWKAFDNETIQHKFNNLFTDYLRAQMCCNHDYTVEVESEHQIGVYYKSKLVYTLDFSHYGIPSDLVRRRINKIKKNLEEVKNDKENKQ